jgi:hypothetical protein
MAKVIDASSKDDTSSERLIIWSAVTKRPNDIEPAIHYYLDIVRPDGAIFTTWSGDSYWDAVASAKNPEWPEMPIEDLVGDRTTWTGEPGPECDSWGWQQRWRTKEARRNDPIALPEFNPPSRPKHPVDMAGEESLRLTRIGEVVKRQFVYLPDNGRTPNVKLGLTGEPDQRVVIYDANTREGLPT